MQNKPNFQDVQMNVTIFLKMAYENIANWTLGENKPKQTQFQNPTPKEREEKKVSGKLLKKQFYYFMSQNQLIPHYIARTRILNNFLRC